MSRRIMSEERHTTYVDRRQAERVRTIERKRERGIKRAGRVSFGGTY